MDLRDGSAQTVVCAATLRQMLQINLATSPSHCTLSPGQPAPALTRQPLEYRLGSLWFDWTWEKPHGRAWIEPRGRYHGGRPPSSDDSLHSPTLIPPSALDKPSIMKRYHRRRTCSHTSPRRPPTMVTLRDTGFVECRCWNDGWTVKTVVT